MQINLIFKEYKTILVFFLDTFSLKNKINKLRLKKKQKNLIFNLKFKIDSY